MTRADGCAQTKALSVLSWDEFPQCVKPVGVALPYLLAAWLLGEQGASAAYALHMPRSPHLAEDIGGHALLNAFPRA